jgi:hypothetical protein
MHEALALIPSTTKKRKKERNMNKPLGARSQWLTPIILATQEADIRRIAV